MIATTIEQSRHLLELGLDPKTADMCFEMDKGNWTLNVGKKSAQVNRGFAIPAWSLSALLEVIPRDSALYKIENTYSMHHGWTTENHTNPIDAAYEIVCWLLEQGYIKKGGNNDKN